MHLMSGKANHSELARTPEQNEALAELLTLARDRRAESDAQLSLGDEVMACLRGAGVFRAMVAREFGGDELPPSDFLRLVERISMADGSTGWIASLAATSLVVTALPITTLKVVFVRSVDILFAGRLSPVPVTRVDNGLNVSGRWAWSSGCTGADYFILGVQAVDGKGGEDPAQIAIVPTDRGHIEQNWSVDGMRGTGSHDVVLDRVFVPDGWTFVRGAKSNLDTPLFRYPPGILITQAHAAVGLGIARAALDDFIETAPKRGATYGRATLADRATAQSDLAKAEAELRAAQTYLFAVTEDAFGCLSTGGDLDVAARTLLRLAATHAARAAAEVTRAVYRMSGTVGMFTDSRIARCLRDATVIPQHLLFAEGTWEQAGQVLLGRAVPTGYP
jgi:alkylation response protein AidB-like acyl-CoA dehydrogenase